MPKTSKPKDIDTASTEVMVLIEEALRKIPLAIAAYWRNHSTAFSQTCVKPPERSGVYLVLSYPSESNLQRHINVGWAYWSSNYSKWSLLSDWNEVAFVPEHELTSLLIDNPNNANLYWSGFRHYANPNHLL